MTPIAEMLARYLEVLRGAAWIPALGAVAACGALLLWERAGEALRRRLSWLVLTVLGTLGLARVWARASLFDDAYISLRYAQNLIDGSGLVWNAGERVEGYTNFLWTVLLAAIAGLSRIDLAPVALFASIAAWLGLLAAAYRLEAALASDARTPVLPFATGLIALQESVTTAGTSGLETGFAAGLVCLGALYLVRASRWTDFGWSGLWLILATLTRPDHALFYASAGAAVALDQGVLLWRREQTWRAALRCATAFAAPFTLYLTHLIFRIAYYGETLPNTYYAKAAYLSYFEQGAQYAALFYLSSHLGWLVLPLMLWLLWPTRRRALLRFKVFAGLGLAAYNYYVVKVGGDFMFGRFYVVVVPLALLSLAQGMRDLRTAIGPKRHLGIALAAALGATACGVQLLPPREVRWGIADERTYYRVAKLEPFVIDHANYRVAKLMQSWREAGFQLRIGTSAIGMIGYYSGYEVIDLVGLTDAMVAHQTLKKRGRPGHEKRAQPEYIAKRKPHLMLKHYHPRKYRELAQIHFGRDIARKPWFIYHYDRAAMDRIAELAPTVRFTRFGEYLRRYVKSMAQVPPEEIEQDARFFERYYFAHNEDDELAAHWQVALTKARARAGHASGRAGQD